MFSPLRASHDTGRFWPSATPDALAPRKAGQLGGGAARSEAAARTPTPQLPIPNRQLPLAASTRLKVGVAELWRWQSGRWELEADMNLYFVTTLISNNFGHSFPVTNSRSVVSS